MHIELKLENSIQSWAAFLSVAVAFKFIKEDKCTNYDVYIFGHFIGDSIMIMQQGFDWFNAKYSEVSRGAA